MDRNSHVVGTSTPPWDSQPKALEKQQNNKEGKADAQLRSEQRATPLLVQLQPVPGGTAPVSGTGPHFREEASASSEDDSVSSEDDSVSSDEDSLDAAIDQGDAAAVVRALRTCADVRQRVTMKPMLLQALAGDGHLEGVRLLLEAQADVNVRCSRKRTPLIYAAAGGSAEVIEALLDHGANPGKRDDAGNTALHVAVLCRQHAAAAALLGGMDPEKLDQRNSKGCSALFEAVSLEDAAMVRLLLQSGAQVDFHWHEMWSVTPLMLAAARGNADMLRNLLAAGADPEAPDWMAATALFHAVRGGSLACVGALLDAGADINARDSRYSTPLLCAVELSSTAMADALLARGAAMTHRARLVRNIGETSCKTEDADFVDEDGPCRRTMGSPHLERVPEPALLLAVCKGLDDMAELLIDYGADVNFVAANGDTALAKANELGHHAIVERLLAHGARQ